MSLLRILYGYSLRFFQQTDILPIKIVSVLLQRINVERFGLLATTEKNAKSQTLSASIKSSLLSRLINRDFKTIHSSLLFQFAVC
jgi:hypothetical protein